MTRKEIVLLLYVTGTFKKNGKKPVLMQVGQRFKNYVFNVKDFEEFDKVYHSVVTCQYYNWEKKEVPPKKAQFVIFKMKN